MAAKRDFERLALLASPDEKAQEAGARLADTADWVSLEQADALVVVTEWNEFRNPDFEVMARLLREPVIFDGRNLYDPARMAALGFVYHGIGRAPVDGQ